MTRYGIKRMDTGKVLPEPFINFLKTSAELDRIMIIQIGITFKCKLPDLEVVPLEDSP